MYGRSCSNKVNRMHTVRTASYIIEPSIEHQNQPISNEEFDEIIGIFLDQFSGWFF